MNKKTPSSLLTESSTAKNYTAPALEKGLDILELLARQRDGLKLKDIAQMLEKSVSEIFRMVCVLERREYLQLDGETDKYHLSLKLFEVAHNHVPIRSLVEAATGELDALSKVIGQSCHVTVCHNQRAVVVAQKDSPMDKLITIRLGASSELPDSCSGHIFIAFSEPEEQQQLITELRGRVSETALKNLISVVRQQGYERMLSRHIQGVEDIGFPIFDRHGQLAACLVVPYLHYIGEVNTVDINSAIAQVQLSARRISILLGHKAES